MFNIMKFTLLPVLVASAFMTAIFSLRYLIQGVNAVEALGSTDELLEFLSGQPGRFWFDFAASQLPLYHRNEFAVVGHIVGASIALLTGFVQFIPLIRNKAALLHRATGYLYTFTALTGLFLGAYISVTLPMIGGTGAIIANVVGGALGIIFILIAFISIWKKKYVQHEQWMMRSFAILLTIVTVYLLIPAFSLAGLEAEQGLSLAHWVCFPINLLIAELIIQNSPPGLFVTTA